MVIGSVLATLPDPPYDQIPSNFFTVNDQQGANDVPGQVDLTRMGRDDSDATKYKIFMSWDSIDQWTGTGQTGDACALFDTNGDGNIDFVVCGQITNPDADPTVVSQTGTSPYAFNCSDKKNDRCTNPSSKGYTFGQEITSGPLGHVSEADRYANLITGTDPFDSTAANGPGTSYPFDSTLEVDIRKDFLPDGARLTNVCSYPSAGNGGNNNPFDCIVSPGGGFLVITKAAGTTTQQFTFDTTNTPQTSYTVTGSQSTSPIGVLITKQPSITERVVENWMLQSIACTKQDGSPTGTVDPATPRTVSGIVIESGRTTTCTFTNAPVRPKLTVTKVVVNDNGGTKVVSDFPLFVGSTSVTSGVQNTFDAGAYTVSETGDPGYSATITGDCASDGSITLALGDVKSCTITNDDDAPSLKLIKHVVNDNGGTAVASAWTLSAGSNDVTGSETAVEVTDQAGTYALSETSVNGYTNTSITCDDNVGVEVTSVTIGLGETKTCTFVNDDDKAAPSGETIQSWVLHDSITITGIRPNSPAPAASVTFTLYGNDACTGPAVGSETDNTIEGGVASTTNGIAVSDTGFYYWIVTYSGDQYNEGFSTTCGDEVTQIQAKDAFGGGRSNLLIAT